MQLSLLLSLTSLTLALALPTPNPDPQLLRQPRPISTFAATIYKQRDLATSPLGNDSTFIPGVPSCTDLSNIFGGFDGEVRSLSVERGWSCRFYKEEGCGVNDFQGGGAVLEVGFRDRVDKRRWLGSWEKGIKSVVCGKI